MFTVGTEVLLASDYQPKNDNEEWVQNYSAVLTVIYSSWSTTPRRYHVATDEIIDDEGDSFTFWVNEDDVELA